MSGVLLAAAMLRDYECQAVAFLFPGCAGIARSVCGPVTLTFNTTGERSGRYENLPCLVKAYCAGCLGATGAGLAGPLFRDVARVWSEKGATRERGRDVEGPCTVPRRTEWAP